MSERQRDEWPEAVRDLPVCPIRKLPIPFVTPYEDGRAAFTALDPVRKQEIARYRLCGVCGKPMGHWIVFLGDVVSTEPGGEYIEPPMHEACAEAAIKLCPFVSRQHVPRRPTDPRDVYTVPLGTFEVGRNAAPKRPWVMAYTRGFKLVARPAFGAAGVTEVFLPAKIMRTRRFEYVDGRLQEV